MRAILVFLALAMPAHAQAPVPGPMVSSELECGSLVGRGRVKLVLGGQIHVSIEVACGLTPV